MSDITEQHIWQLIRIRRFAQAKQMLAEGLAQQPDNVSFLYALAHIAWQQDELNESLEILSKGMALAPMHEGLLYVRFYVLFELDKKAEAESIIIDLITRNPRAPDYICAYSRLMLFAFQLAKARQLCDEALRIDPTHTAARQLDVLINLALGRHKSLDKQLATLLMEDPESERNLYLLRNMLVDRRKFAEALLITQQLIRKHPNNLGNIQTAIELKRLTHWSALPLWPLHRFGWPASFGLWMLYILISRSDLPKMYPIVSQLWIPYLIWFVYSWLHGPLLGKWLKYRGI